MKIASVTFYPLYENIGGGQIPAIAFKKWCDIFNIECDVIGITNSNNKISNEINRIIKSDDFGDLNEYDAIFFSTPPIFTKVDFDLIKTKFICMIHGECDVDLYGESIVREVLRHKYSLGYAHIDSNKYFNENNDSNFFWHPCCNPSDLINSSIKARSGDGILYAARISQWLNPDLFIDLANRIKQNNKNYMFGNTKNLTFLDSLINLNNLTNNVIIENKPFTRGEKYIDGTSLFWSVEGGSKNLIRYNRLSLSAYEAINNGYMPIVAKGKTLDFLKGLVIEVDIENFSAYRTICDIANYIYKKDVVFNEITDKIRTSCYGYNGVKYQISIILKALGAKI